MDSEQLAAAAVWVDQYAAASEDLKDRADQVVRAAWLAFDGWYDTAAVTALATQMADVSLAAQQTSTGLASEYVRRVLDVLQVRIPGSPRIRTPQVRGGADLRLVHSRPAEAFRKAVATGSAPEEALDRAVERAGNLTRSDLSLVERQVEQTQLEHAGIQRFRRVIRPELSESGSCGLCVVASDRIYTIRELMPIHPPHCKCKTMPITETDDPGLRINQDDLKRIYEAAGSTSGDDLKRVRIQVNEHGELGPVLARGGDSFRSQRQVPLEKDPARAARMLEKTLPVLDDLEKRAAAGADVTGPLTYQQQLVERLRNITAAAA